MANRGCGCKTPTDIRITEGGQMEASFDGGFTYEPFLGDPGVIVPVIPLPPGFPVSNGQCSGANSATTVFRTFTETIMNNEAAWETIIALVGLIIAAFAAFFGIGAFVGAMIGAVVTIIFLLGRTLFIGAFDEALWEELNCIFYCNMSMDASVSTAQSDAIYKAVKETTWQFAAQQWILLMLIVLQRPGITNAARTFPNLLADCSGCNCSCDAPVLAHLGTNLLPRPDLGAGWWEVTTEDSLDPNNTINGRFFAIIELAACCLHVQYQIEPPGILAPPGNRQANDCLNVPGFANFGVGGCQSLIAFRSYGVDKFTFQILECP